MKPHLKMMGGQWVAKYSHKDCDWQGCGFTPSEAVQSLENAIYYSSMQAWTKKRDDLYESIYPLKDKDHRQPVGLVYCFMWMFFVLFCVCAVLLFYRH